MQRLQRTTAVFALLAPYIALSGCLSGLDSSSPSKSATAGPNAAPAGKRHIVFNLKVLADRELAALESLEADHAVRLPDQRYWYDRVSGAFGVEGGPALALIPPGMDLGGPLRSDASNGTTGIFVNGRQLPLGERNFMQGLIGARIAPGRYWLVHDGTWGHEGGVPQGNLVAAAREAAQQAGGAGRRGSLLGGSFLTETFVNAAGAASRDGSSVNW